MSMLPSKVSDVPPAMCPPSVSVSALAVSRTTGADSDPLVLSVGAEIDSTPLADAIVPGTLSEPPSTTL